MERKLNYNPLVIWKNYKGKRIVYFKFDGFFTKSDAIYGLNRMAKLIFSEREKTPVVWNCLDMEGYEDEARDMCQQMITEQLDNIGDLYLISKAVDLMAATEIVSFFTNNEIKYITSEEDFVKLFTKS